MEEYTGKAVSDCIAIGKIRVFSKEDSLIEKISVQDTAAEKKRYEAARAEAVLQLEELYEKAAADTGEEAGAIFKMHSMLLEDPDYVGSVNFIIASENTNSEHAVKATGEKLASIFSEMEDEYMKERAADITDVTERLIRILTGKTEDFILREPAIIVAEDLTPSETVQMDKSKILAFVTRRGSVNSHTAILARMMGIPALIGTNMAEPRSLEGKLAVADGKKGIFLVEPDAKQLKVYEEKQKEEAEHKADLKKIIGKETVTQDGRTIKLYANIGSTEDLSAVLEQDAGGIGLFRSEFLYLEKDNYPTEEEQFQAYKQVLEAMEGKKVIIRTLDIGADKQAEYFQMEKEENPAMGCRAIRICLERIEVFKTQLRALLRASVFGNLAVMYPMIISVEEIIRIKEIVEEVKQELTDNSIPFGRIEQGIMVETPAAVLISDLLAKEADFFSIGTNDLTQYTLAVDRQNPKLISYYNPKHEAVLRMIQMVVKNGHEAGIWVGICGELAADLSLTEVFLRAGVDELSVSPPYILPVRERVRQLDLSK